MLLFEVSMLAQSPISTINITTNAGASTIYTAAAPSDASNLIGPSTNYRVNNGTANNEQVASYVISSTSYSNFVRPDTLIIQRTDGSRFVNIWYTLTQFDNSAAPIRLVLEADAVSDADALYQSGNVNAGYDNILVNTDDQGGGTIQAQIERVDVIWYNGIVTCAPANAVFPVIERGGNDEIRIAAITALDANGNPSAYSSTVLVEDSDWPQTGVTYNNYLVLRRQTVGQDPLPLINIGLLASQSAQTVQGVAVSFQELGISAGQIVYGYSLFASDTNEANSGIDLTDINTFPTNTLASNSGIDLVAGVSAAVSSDDCLVEAVGPGGYKSTLSTWLKANDGALTTSGGSVPADGGSVGLWEDQAVGNHDFTTLVTSPVYRSTSSQVNFNPTVSFEENLERGLLTASNEDFDNATGNPVFTRKGINIVFRTNANDIFNRQQIYEQGGTDNGIGVYIENGNLYVSSWQRTNQGTGSPWNDGTNANYISTFLKTDTEYILTLEQDGNTSINGSLRAYLNGQQFAVLSSVGLLFNDVDGVGLGDVNNTSRYDNNTTAAASFDGEIPEFIYCNEPGGFTQAQRQKTESYLAIKYGITLDQSTPLNYVNSDGDIVFNTTDNTGLGGFLSYNKDIAGIARDDGSELDQPTSKSEVISSLVKVEKVNPFGQDNTWLIWGNDGSSFSTQSADVPGVVSDRLQRVWRVSETGESGLLNLSFDNNIMGLSGTANDFSLLIADANSNGVFSAANVISGATISGGEITFAGVNLTEGQFFTLGTGFLTCGPGGVSSNLSFWLKGDAGTSTTTNGAEVTSWADQSNSNDATGTTGTVPVMVTSGQNFNPTLSFNGIDEVMVGNAGFYSDAYFIMGSPTNTIDGSTQNQVLLGYTTASSVATDNIGGFYLGTFFGGASDVIGHAIGVQTAPIWLVVEQSATTQFDAGKGYVLSARHTTALNETEVYSNGIRRDGTRAGAFLEVSNELYTLGNFNSNSFNLDRFFNGEIGEVFSYTVRPSDSEIERIESYLGVKYGITLDQSTANDYEASNSSDFWTATNFTGFNNDIAGVARDDLSCLEQKQSKSQNDGAILTMGLGSVAVDNAANANAFSADLSALMWSSDAASTIQANANTSDVPATVTERMTRIWKVQESGTVGDMSVSFDLTGLGYSTTATDFQLIVSGSSTMASGITYTGGVLNSNVITFSGIDFADGDFFTLGTQALDCAPGGVSNGLALWLRADEGTNTVVDGASLTSWADQSSQNRNAATATLGGASPVNPTFESSEINFNPAIRFLDVSSTNNVYLNTTNGNTVTDNLTIIGVYKSGQTDGTANTMTTSPAIVGADASGDLDYGLGLQGGNAYINAANTNTFTAQSAAQYVSNVPHIVTGTRALSGNASLYIDSSLDGTGVSDASSLSTPTSFGIGNHSVGTTTAQFDGFIGEVIVFGSALDSDEQSRVESYLGLKYGITRNAVDEVSTTTIDERDYRSANGTVTWDYSGQTSTYYNDIAGIGNDVSSCFSQLKSKSNSTDARVTMSVNSFSSDNTFLTWGNDNAVLENTDNREFDESQVKSRLNREWQVQETGTLGTVSLEFDLTGVTGPTGVNTNNLSQVRLLLDADGDFTSGVSLVPPTSISGTIATFDVDFTLANGYFFTLGSEQQAALSVVLVAFTADITSENDVELRWKTDSEQDNAMFVLQRSKDGLNFESLATIGGAGNSNELLGYQFLDKQPYRGRSYYRLKQVDFNGEIEYSFLVNVRLEQKGDLIIYPNPAPTGEAGFSIRLPDGVEVYTIHIFDAKGVSQLKMDTPEVNGIDMEVKWSPDDKGLYLVVLNTSEGRKVLKLIRQ